MFCFRPAIIGQKLWYDFFLTSFEFHASFNYSLNKYLLSTYYITSPCCILYVSSHLIFIIVL